MSVCFVGEDSSDFVMNFVDGLHPIEIVRIYYVIRDFIQAFFCVLTENVMDIYIKEKNKGS